MFNSFVIVHLQAMLEVFESSGSVTAGSVIFVGHY